VWLLARALERVGFTHEASVGYKTEADAKYRAECGDMDYDEVHVKHGLKSLARSLQHAEAVIRTRVFVFMWLVAVHPSRPPL
jgi:hypothetical protein